MSRYCRDATCVTPREDTDLSELNSALVAIRVKLAGGLDVDAAVENATRPAAMWRGGESPSAEHAGRQLGIQTVPLVQAAAGLASG